MKNNKFVCSFCGKKASDVKNIIQGSGFGNNAFICNECIMIANKMIQENNIKNKTFDYNNLKPVNVKRYLDDHIIGQERAKKVLSVAIYNHYKRINNPAINENDIDLQKSNVLIVGPTGTGKTLLVQTIAKVLDIPIAITDATSLTEAGYVGEDVENVITKLVQNANYDIEKAEKGIIYIDEIDKIGRKSESVSITRDVSGEGVQQSLLKIIEGSTINVPPVGGRKHPEQEYLKVNTKDILFICGGAFDGIENIIKKRINIKSNMGFIKNMEVININNEYDFLNKIIPNDLTKYGLIPELIGRMPVITVMNELNYSDLIRILIEPKNSIIKQYIKLFKLDNIELEYEIEALEEIARLADERNVGARGLRSILEDVMIDIMYEMPSKDNVRKCIITKDTILNKQEPVLLFNKKAS